MAAQPGIEVVVSCGDLPSLLEAVESERPDVVVTDIRMPPTSTDEGIRAAVLLREQHPDIGVVVLSNYAEPRRGDGTAGVRIEGRAYLLKKRIHDRAQLVAAIESVPPAASWWTPRSSNRSSPHAGTSNAAGRAVGASAAASAA